ncbi:TusE/DsrC/DsvC family sulfur relay protein [Gilvimarinus sp. DA14]|uniref:TusE/DsrC/DsvC family sulfur relay protein n=1 Tax=Gilvimarinus sp. DA14 TaxID=2956798 RepID=UPI0020B74DD2|nr:TusE/DsrC/DsvC family sulfur relay protein [Gilvimarinus sp. DA14]UTF60539.1 TusE/DsrC/DsvC family sulfur relay protein [Gilvimarinus sp. DA14]
MSDLILPAVDKDGYLCNLQDWTPEVAVQLAQQSNITLSEAHWEVIHLVQQFYREFELSPASRALVRYVQQHLGKDKGRSIYLLQLFPPHPALIVNKLAGLPRPANCF